MKYEFKRDRYSRARGGNSQWLNLGCANCGHCFALYQKDGPGALLRIYLDRIFAPEGLAQLQNMAHGRADLLNLSCEKCGSIIGVPMIYDLENRLAFRMNRGAFTKKKGDGTYP